MVRPPAAAVCGMERTEVLELVEADALGAGVRVDGEAMVYGENNDDHEDDDETSDKRKQGQATTTQSRVHLSLTLRLSHV